MMEGVVIKDLPVHRDARGWLVEFFRADEIAPSMMPVMSYVSSTLPGVARGPHEHLKQTDYFCFAGPSNFKVYLWDNRKNSRTYKKREVYRAGEDSPKAFIIPPGVVHAYKNVGGVHGLVFNAPNRLYMGPDRKEEVDEIRHEDSPDTGFILD
ncbi:MAG: dTDP-4-dehydrorhamnose 3,5-epimerase family protein [Deltaproteobacteria bacterium]|nr:dTDP-4-dehydrorhamnose 3,5-epimerase family protein [Deltaproteobacteria bacterium]